MTSIEVTVNTPTIEVVLPIGIQGAQGPAGDATRSASVMLNGAEAGSAPLTTGDSKAVLRVPDDLDGLELTGVAGCAVVPSSAGAITVQVRRVRAGVSADMLTTPLTIDEGEVDSTTAVSQPVINTSNDDLLEADQIHIDVDAAGDGALGVIVTLKFETI